MISYAKFEIGPITKSRKQGVCTRHTIIYLLSSAPSTFEEAKAMTLATLSVRASCQGGVEAEEDLNSEERGRMYMYVSYFTQTSALSALSAL